jgi:transposase
MMTQRQNTQLKMYSLTIEDMVPQGHFLCKLDAMIDLSFIYDEVRNLYSAVGRPSIDPVILIKSLLLGYIYGIQSERYLEMEIQVNIAFRWFLRLDLDEAVPDHSTMSQNRRRKFNGTPLFRKIFEKVLAECIEKGLADGKLIVTDSTHIKADASGSSAVTIEVEKEASAYMALLDKYEAEERAALESAGKIAPKRSSRRQVSEDKKTERTVYTSDPEAGKLGRPGKPVGAHYLNHQAIDAKNGIIVDVTVTPGNVNDSEPYLAQLEHIKDATGLVVESVAADSGYDTSLIHKVLEEQEITVFMPKKDFGGGKKVEFVKDDFVYDETADTFACPNGCKLTLRCVQRGESTVTREYRAETKDCKNCPQREKCLAPSQKSRKLQVNIFEGVYQKHHENDGSPEYRSALKARQVWCEGTFAAQKRVHNLRQMLRAGLEAAYDHCLLSATAINLKRMIKCALRAA